MLDEKKSWLNVRCNNLQVDGTTTLSTVTGTATFTDVVLDHLTVLGEVYADGIYNTKGLGGFAIANANQFTGASSLLLQSEAGGITLEPAAGKYVTVKEGFKFTNDTAGYTASALNFYETLNTTLTTSGAFITPLNFSISRLGNIITISCNGMTTNETSTNATLQITAAQIGARFLPSSIYQETRFFGCGINDSSPVQLVGYVSKTLGLVIGVLDSGTMENFIATSSVYSFTLTYSLY